MIEKLKELQKTRGFDFEGLDNFIDWADKVEPLLSISPKHEKEFQQARARAETCFRIKSFEDAYNNMNEAIGILNKAVTFLEMPQQSTEPTQQELEYPQKITWTWLVKHVEVKHWFFVGTALLAIFGAGITFGTSKFYQDYFKGKNPESSLSNKASPNTENSSNTSRSNKIVFVSSLKVKSDFGGVAVADTLCNNLASKAGFEGEFKAWLSDSHVGPATRFKKHNSKYTLPSGKLVAENIEQIISCSDKKKCLDFPINENESGMIVSKPSANSPENRVWSATDLRGHPLGNSCRNWSEQIPVPKNGLNNTVVSLGDPTSTGAYWTSSYSANCPDLELAFYCFEQ